jgi:hypothetical protein
MSDFWVGFLVAISSFLLVIVAIMIVAVIREGYAPGERKWYWRSLGFLFYLAAGLVLSLVHLSTGER